MKTDIVIVGGGIVGLSTAYNLAKLGAKGVAVLEKKYVGFGSSTRNAAHFRAHFWSRENTLFAIEARKRLLRLAGELGWNPLLELGGYLWLVYDEAVLQNFEYANKRLWSRLGVGVKFLEKPALKKRYPYLNLDGVIAGVFGPQDGKLHHDFITFGYYSAAKRLGVNVLEYTEAKGVAVRDGEVQGVETSRGFIRANNVVVAADVWSADVLKGIGIELPTRPERKELCVTEPMKPFIEPLIIPMNRGFNGLYVSQTVRGELMGSVDYPPSEGIREFGNTLACLSMFARSAIRLIPALKYARFLRVWSGFYDVSPDNSHIMGRDERWPRGVYVASGTSGHGFMMAPYIGELLAMNILFGVVHEHMRPYLPDRFEAKRLIHETMVIG